ncbi:hypothetical protein [Streptomyces flavalbus]|uniref:Tat pathway signal sequence domain protein n=1 Tax=Streptomyces flavalbus TaxID=2665155 RepID=A0ABW2WAK6_9ACTN
MNDHGFEERVRELLAEDAHMISPSAAPYPDIRRRGVAWRRRRVAATGAALVTLAAVPVGAYALGGSGGSGGGAGPAASASAAVSATPTPTPTPTTTAAAPRGVLLDGITYAQALEDLEYCVEFEWPQGPNDDYGDPADYRLLLAMRSTGDSNTPGDGRFVVAVDDTATTRLICNVKDGDDGPGRNFGGGDVAGPDAGPVVPDINAQKLYAQSFLDKGNWTLPFRWADIGTVEDSVKRVTVEYGGETSEAVLDDGWFVATGELDRQVTEAPRVKGYDAGGELVYDSDEDPTYDALLP